MAENHIHIKKLHLAKIMAYGVIVLSAVCMIMGSLGYLRSLSSIDTEATIVCPAGYTWDNTTCTQTISSLRGCVTGATLDATTGLCVLPRSVQYVNAAANPQQNFQVTDPDYSPANGWSLVPGSIRNNWSGNTKVLADTLYTQEGLRASPSAGYYGQPNDQVSGTLPIRYSQQFTFVSCSRDLPFQQRDRYISDASASGSYNQQCNGGGVEENSQIIPLNADSRYLNYAQCSRSFTDAGVDTNILERHTGVNWSFSSVPLNQDSCIIEGYSERTFFTQDMLNNRFLIVTLCSKEFPYNGQTYREFRNYVRASNISPAIDDAQYPTCDNFYTNVEGQFFADFYSGETNSGSIDYSVSRPLGCPDATYVISPSNPNTCIKTQTITPTGYIPDQPGNITLSPTGCNPTTGSTLEANQTIDCSFTLSGAPDGIPYITGTGITSIISTSTGTPAVCLINESALVCNTIPSQNSQGGTRDLLVTVNGGTSLDLGDYIILVNNINLTPNPINDVTPTVDNVTPTVDWRNISINCDPALVNSLTNCRFNLPDGQTIPNGVGISIGDGVIGGTCSNSIVASEVTCTGIPTGSLVGNQPIFAVSEGGIKTRTLGSVNIYGSTVLARTGGDSNLFLGLAIFSAIIFAICAVTLPLLHHEHKNALVNK